MKSLLVLLCPLLLSCNLQPAAAGQSHPPRVQLPSNPYALDPNTACGPLCVAFLDDYLSPSAAHPYAEILDQCPPSQFGTNLEQVKETLERFGYHTMAFRGAALDQLNNVGHPIILHLQEPTGNRGHFLVLLRWDNERKGFLGFDPPERYGLLDTRKLVDRMTGLGLVVSKDPLPAMDQVFVNQATPIDWAATCLVVLCGAFLVFRASVRDERRKGHEVKNAQPVTASVILLAVTTFFGALGCSRPNQPVPAIEKLDERHVDVGTVLEGPPIEHAFSIRNGSSGPFKILKVEKSCECQLVEADYVHETAPGAAATVRVRIPTAGREGPQRQRFVVITTSKDPNSNNIELTVSATVDAKIKAIPSAILFHKVPAASGSVAKLQIRGRDPRLVEKFISASTTVPYLSVKRCANGLGLLVFDVALDPGSPPGAIYGEIHLDFRDSEVPKLVVPVSGYRTGIFATVPRAVIAKDQPGNESRQRVRVYTEDRSPFRIERVEAPGGVLVQMHESKQPSPSHDLTLAFQSKLHQKVSYVNVHTDRGDYPVVRVPLLANDGALEH